jgi:ATP-binding cassette subfamily F protein 3
VLQELTEGDPAMMRLKKEKEELEALGQAGSHRYADIIHELDRLGYSQLEYKAKQILAGLGFKQRDFSRPILELSGGWQMRTLLARLLTFEYDLLLLDEPTNYLDLSAALWFKDYLADYKGTFIIISHDRDFLDDVTNYTLVLENGVISKVKGNYEEYYKLQDQKRDFLLRQHSEQEKRRKQLQEFVDRFHAQPNKASQVRAKKKQLEMMEEIIVPADYRESIKSFKFPATKQSGYNVIKLNKMSKAYGDLPVYKDFDFEISRGEKAVLAGENGAGKSTLLKILAGVIPVDSGQRVVGVNVDIGYFSQARLDVLNFDNTVLEEAYSAAGGRLPPENLRTILGAFLFRGDDVEKKVKVLSGGEKSRLILAKLLINPPNFLLLDEPTTHLDVDAVEALIKALNDYEGTIVFISHDIHFVRSLANGVYEVKDGQVRKYPGRFDYYLEKSQTFTQGKTKTASGKKTGEGQASQVLNPAAENTVGTDKEEHNAKLAKKIKSLRKQKEKLEIEKGAKQRIVDNPRHGEDIVRYYQLIVKDLDDKIMAIEIQIRESKTKFIQ